MGVKLVSTSGGSVSIDAPVTLNNYVLTTPAASGTMVLDTASQTLTNKTLTAPNINSAPFATVSGVAPLYACRAWVNFNGTGTVAIRGSGNVSSITDNGTGNYSINFTTAMSDANYNAVGMTSENTTNPRAIGKIAAATTAVTVKTINFSLTALDCEFVDVSVFR